MLKWFDFKSEEYTLVSEDYIYEDIDYSGASAIEEREALPRLFEDAKNKKFDVVVCWK